jgi:hypothetical protein
MHTGSGDEQVESAAWRRGREMNTYRTACLMAGMTAMWLSGCARFDRADMDLRTDELAPLVEHQFGVSRAAVQVNEGQRVDVELMQTPWRGESDSAHFDHAYDVARLIWDRYGLLHGIDTISVRTAEGGTSRQHYFFPEQLRHAARPRYGH